MTTRREAIEAVIDSQNNVFGLMDAAFDFNLGTVAESIRLVKDIQTACSQYLEAMYGLQRQRIEWEEVLEYAERTDSENESE